MTRRLCSVCREPQADSVSGVVCRNGHGGADSIVEPLVPSSIAWRNVSTTSGPGRNLHEADVAWAKAWIWLDADGRWRLTCNAVLLTGAILVASNLEEAKVAALAVIDEFAFQRIEAFNTLRRATL